jgi:hypothetical protein
MAYRRIDTITQGPALARIDWASELQEHRVSIMQNGALIGEYFTPDRDDAIRTARAELDRIAPVIAAPITLSTGKTITHTRAPNGSIDVRPDMTPAENAEWMPLYIAAAAPLPAGVPA